VHEERDMTEKKAKLSRRNFLLTLGAGGAATAAAIVAKTPTESKDTSNDKRATRGYQASEHVNNYYRTTKV
jgi:shikimate 5-dehydrogenase